MIFVLIAASIAGLSTARSEGWHDPSPHKISFVTVQPGVKIETLDWGGAGRGFHHIILPALYIGAEDNIPAGILKDALSRSWTINESCFCGLLGQVPTTRKSISIDRGQ
jgi:hypothetical protein